MGRIHNKTKFSAFRQASFWFYFLRKKRVLYTGLSAFNLKENEGNEPKL